RSPLEIVQRGLVAVGEHGASLGQDRRLHLHISSRPRRSRHSACQTGLSTCQSRQEGGSKQRLGRGGLQQHRPSQEQRRQQRLHGQRRKIRGEHHQHRS